MGQTTDIKIIGLNRIIGKLKQISQEYPDRLEGAMFIVTSEAADAVRPGTPYQYGNLRASIDNKVYRKAQEIIGLVFTPVFYGIYVHFGTYKMKARPFMNVAIRHIASNAVNTFRRVLKI